MKMGPVRMCGPRPGPVGCCALVAPELDHVLQHFTGRHAELTQKRHRVVRSRGAVM